MNSLKRLFSAILPSSWTQAEEPSLPKQDRIVKKAKRRTLKSHSHLKLEDRESGSNFSRSSRYQDSKLYLGQSLAKCQEIPALDKHERSIKRPRR